MTENKNKLLLEKLDNTLNGKNINNMNLLLKEFGSILLNERNKYEVVWTPISDSKTINKKQSIEIK